MEPSQQVEIESNTPKNPVSNNIKENGVFGIMALILTIACSLGINSLLISLNNRNNVAVKLWQPSESVLFFTAPTFAFISLILIWIMAPKVSQMKQIFKITGIIGIVLYVIYMVCVGYMFALGSGMKN